MATKETPLDKARAAKQEVKRMFRRKGLAGAVGLTRKEDSYAVKVNLEQPLRDDEALPAEVSGVPLVVEVVGKIRKLS